MCEDGGLAMIRLENISVVLIRQTEAFGVHPDESGEAHPMPAAAADRLDEPHVVRPRPSIERTGFQRDELVRRIEDGPATAAG